MDIISLILFISCWLIIFYTYLGYPLLLLCLGFLKRTTTHCVTKRRAFEPHVSFVIAAYNEEKNIANKLDNIWKVNYPKDKIRVLVCSDNSSDRTNEILEKYTKIINLHPVFSQKRQGKTDSENILLGLVESEYVIFTDASAMIHPDVVKLLIRHFYENKIGCVSSHDVDPDSSLGESTYVRLEMFVRQQEGRIDSIVGLSGSCYAARTDLCGQLPPEVTRDFEMTLSAKMKGYKSISEPAAHCYVRSTNDQMIEFKRKVRTFCNGMDTLRYRKQLLNIFNYGSFSLFLISHKVFRWLLPYFFIGQFVALLVLHNESIMFTSIIIIEILMLFASICYSILNIPSYKLIKMLTFQLMTLTAALFSSLQFLFNKKHAIWKPTIR